MVTMPRGVLGPTQTFLRCVFYEHVLSSGQDVVAFDMDDAVVHQNRDESSRVDTEEPRGVVLLRAEIDGVGNPGDVLQIEEDPRLL